MVTVTAIAFLLAEALAAGISIAEIMAETKKTGLVSDETWANIMADMESAREDLGLDD